MKTLKITIGSLLIALCSCSKMDTNTGSGKVRLIKEFNNWIVDKTTSKPNLDEKIELQLDSITSLVKKSSLYPDELKMEVMKTTEIDLTKMVNEYHTMDGKPSNGYVKNISEETKTALLTKFKADNVSLRVLCLRFRNRITDNEVQFEYLNVLFDQNGQCALLADHTTTDDITFNLELRATSVIYDFIKETIDELDSKPDIEQPKTDNHITYYTKEEFDNFPPSGRKDFMEHNLEWIEKTRKEDTEKIENNDYLSSTDKAEYLKEIETDYAKRIEDVKNDFEARFK